MMRDLVMVRIGVLLKVRVCMRVKGRGMGATIIEQKGWKSRFTWSSSMLVSDLNLIRSLNLGRRQISIKFEVGWNHKPVLTIFIPYGWFIHKLTSIARIPTVVQQMVLQVHLHIERARFSFYRILHNRWQARYSYVFHEHELLYVI